MEKSSLDLLKEYRSIVSETIDDSNFEELRQDVHAIENKPDFEKNRSLILKKYGITLDELISYLIDRLHRLEKDGLNEGKNDKELTYKEKVAKGKLCADCGSCRPVKGGNGYCKKCAGMNESKIQGASDPNRIVKCGCGLPMRANRWSDHWRSCKVARGVPVTQQDKEDLEAYEARLSESIVDKSPIASFLTRNGFENDTAGSDEMVSTFTNEEASLKIHIYSDDKYWTIEDINQPDEILEDGSGINELSKMVAHLLNMASGTPEPTNTVNSGKFNTCSNCDGKGCASCDYTGEYAIGLNKHHYD